MDLLGYAQTQAVVFSLTAGGSRHRRTEWDDERFDRDGQVELYESLGSTGQRSERQPMSQNIHS